MYRLYFSVLIFITLLAGCDLTNRKDKVFEYLNKTESRFDKKSYELVELNLLDTIYENEIYRFYDQNEDTDHIISIDSTVGPDPNATNSIDWKEQKFSVGLFRHIYHMSSTRQLINSDGSPNAFFDLVQQMDFKDFEQTLLLEDKFKKRLIAEMKKYGGFTGVYNADSVEHNVKIELDKSKRVYGYEYDLKYRVKTVLHNKHVLFDKQNNEILSHYNIPPTL